MSLCFLRFELPTRDIADMSRRKYEFKDVEVTVDKELGTQMKSLYLLADLEVLRAVSKVGEVLARSCPHKAFQDLWIVAGLDKRLDDLKVDVASEFLFMILPILSL
jgi:hypothetical protein